jgi:hypothetical protein
MKTTGMRISGIDFSVWDLAPFSYSQFDVMCRMRHLIKLYRFVRDANHPLCVQELYGSEPLLVSVLIYSPIRAEEYKMAKVKVQSTSLIDGT